MLEARTSGSGGNPSAGCRATVSPGVQRVWQVRTYATPSTVAETVRAVAGETQRAAVTGCLAAAQERDRDAVAGLEGDGPAVDDDPPAGHGGRGAVGHWRIRRPSGSKSGVGCRRAGRRRPMISISKPDPPGPSGVASAVGT